MTVINILGCLLIFLGILGGATGGSLVGKGEIAQGVTLSFLCVLLAGLGGYLAVQSWI